MVPPCFQIFIETMRRPSGVPFITSSRARIAGSDRMSCRESSWLRGAMKLSM